MSIADRTGYTTQPTPGNQRPRWRPLPGMEKLSQPAEVRESFVTSEGQDAMKAAIDAGLGILVSLTSDGGALSLTVYDGNVPYRSYASHSTEVSALWDALAEFATSKQAGAPKPARR